MTDISIICSFYNEESSIPLFINKTEGILRKICKSYEIIFIDDQSIDKSRQVLKEISAKNKNIKYIKMSRNFGNAPCIFAGLQNSKGKCAIIIDCDLEDPPELIHEMYNKYLNEGYDVVHTKRSKREDLSFIKNFFTVLAYKFINFFSEIDLPINAGIYKLISRRALNELLKIDEYDPYLRGLFNWIGFRQTTIEYKRERRSFGASNYSIFKSLNPWKEIMRGVTSFSMIPLYTILLTGLILCFTSIIYLIYIVVQKFFIDVTSGWTSIISLIIIFGSMNILIMGIQGLYLSKIYENVKGRPKYIISEKINIDE